jgi:serine/threonine protein kinase
MPPSGPSSPDRPDGEVTAAPPSDLSDYTWDDSDQESRKSALLGDEGELADGTALRSRSEEFRGFFDGLVLSRFVAEGELRTLCTRLFPDGTPADSHRLSAELVRLGKLTRYQAAAIRQGKTKGLFIGDYVVRDKVGSGGMGIVFRARHRQGSRDVALKLLPPSFSRDRAAVSRFRREAGVVAKLRHPNIVQAMEAGETNGLLFLVMELVDGRDLSRTVKEKGPLTTVQAIDCLIQAARGLEEAHGHGIIHRDIKPANLLLDRSGAVKILDLGLARVNQIREFSEAESSEVELTVSGSIVGTVDYMSPEQAYNPRLADGRSDIYSLGCSLHFLLTGKAPYGGQTFMERLLAHRERPIPSLRDARAGVPAEVDDVFRRLMSKSPEGRPQTMGQVIAELQSCRPSVTGKRAKRSAIPEAAKPTEEEPKSVYKFVDSTEPERSPRPETVSTVFVRNRGSSIDRYEGSGVVRRRRRRRLLLRIVVLITAIAAGWYILKG